MSVHANFEDIAVIIFVLMVFSE